MPSGGAQPGSGWGGCAASQSSSIATPKPGASGRERKPSCWVGNSPMQASLEPAARCALVDHEVGDRGIHMERGQHIHRAVNGVRLHADVLGFGQRRDALHLADPAAVKHIGLDHRHDLPL